MTFYRGQLYKLAYIVGIKICLVLGQLHKLAYAVDLRIYQKTMTCITKFKLYKIYNYTHSFNPKFRDMKPSPVQIALNELLKFVCEEESKGKVVWLNMIQKIAEENGSTEKALDDRMKADGVLYSSNNSPYIILVNKGRRIQEEGGYLDWLRKKEMRKNNDRANYTTNNIDVKGDGNLTSIGNNSDIHNKVIIKKNNFEDLRKLLQDNHVASSDIDELQTIIDEEQPDREKGLFGPQVDSWFQKMIDKSVDRSWQVGVGAAGTLLGEALIKYYGI